MARPAARTLARAATGAAAGQPAAADRAGPWVPTRASWEPTGCPSGNRPATRGHATGGPWEPDRWVVAGRPAPGGWAGCWGGWRAAHQPFRLAISSVRAGMIVNRSPTTPKSASWKMGASASLLTATIVFEVCMPARCWMAPEMPTAT